MNEVLAVYDEIIATRAKGVRQQSERARLPFAIRRMKEEGEKRRRGEGERENRGATVLNIEH